MSNDHIAENHASERNQSKCENASFTDAADLFLPSLNRIDGESKTFCSGGDCRLILFYFLSATFQRKCCQIGYDESINIVTNLLIW